MLASLQMREGVIVMSHTMRLDKLLANAGWGSRSEVKKLVKAKAVLVNGKAAKDSGMHVFPDTDHILVHGEQVDYRAFVYLMMNKPAGVVSATEDARDRTVIDLLPEKYARCDLFPVGRLDKDTVGLLLLTNDGKLAHQLLSPKKNVAKVYHASLDRMIGEQEIQAFAQGVTLDDGYVTKSAGLKLLAADQPQAGQCVAEVTITEGKFHQVKRMARAVQCRVINLKRISMGSLQLDPSLPLGGVRELTTGEYEGLIKEGV